jgi:hypothetical protein
MGWAIGSGIQIRISGKILQEIPTGTYDTLFLTCASELDELKDKSKMICPEGRSTQFFKEVKYLLDFTSSGIFKLTNDLSFLEVYHQLIKANDGVFSPVDMYKILLLLSSFGRKLNEDVWFGLGTHEGCVLFGAFYNAKFDYVKVKKSKISPEDKGNLFLCSKKEMENFFTENYTAWFVSNTP